MISAESVEFFPVVLAIWSIGWTAYFGSSLRQPLRWELVQSPYARLTVGTPYLATSSSSASACLGEVLSASMRTAMRTFSGEGTLGGYPRAVTRTSGGRSSRGGSTPPQPPDQRPARDREHQRKHQPGQQRAGHGRGADQDRLHGPPAAGRTGDEAGLFVVGPRLRRGRGALDGERDRGQRRLVGQVALLGLE